MSLSAEKCINMQVNAPAIIAESAQTAPAGIAAAAADLLQISVVAGQLKADVRMMSIDVRTQSATN